MAKLTDEQRRALQMLAALPYGFSLSTLAGCGFAFEMLEDMVRTGLLTSNRDAIGPGETEVAYLRITEAGRKAIAD